MFKWLTALIRRRAGNENALDVQGFSAYGWLHEFNVFMADRELARLPKVSLHDVQGQGGTLDPGFSMSLREPHQRLWFVLLLCFSVQNNRAALLTLADWAPTDSGALWCSNPPSCPACGSVRPHHREDCPSKPILMFEIDEY